MRRAQTATILALLLAGCAAQPIATVEPTSAPADPPSSSGPSPTSDPTASPEPTAPFEGHPAAGLAVVQFPDAGSPASQIFVVDDLGSLGQVTGLGGGIGATYPAWSPDRSQIAFGPPKVGFPGISGQVSVINADGSGERVLGEGALHSWSPDGTRLLVHEVDDVSPEPRSIWIVDVASGEIALDIGEGFNGQWIDDDTIGFQRVLASGSGMYDDALYVQELDGSEPVELPAESETLAYWSPDGTQVLLVRESIVVADADGSNPRDIATGYAPVWSPDGTRVLLAYDVNQDALPLLALVDLEGNEIWSGAVGDRPSWSPDGTRIAVEVAYPDPTVQVLDAATGQVLWELPGAVQPNWGS